MRKTLHPRYWPTWIALGALWLVARLPYHALMAVGRGLGRVMKLAAGRRRHIAETNLRLCFPSLADAEREALLGEHFDALGMAFMETALSWWGDDRRLRRLMTLDGRQHLDQALEAGRGVILVAAHFTTLEIGARLLAATVPLHPMYRPHNDPVFERIQAGSRTRHSAGAIPRGDLRTTLRVLRGNGVVWYAPDQDFGRRQSVFVPFMGLTAATLTATSRLARASGAAVVPMTQQRLPGGRGYRVVLEPALDGFPSGDDERDAARLNAVFEHWIKQRPADYLWVHRRFKTRPEGGKPLYQAR